MNKKNNRSDAMHRFKKTKTLLSTLAIVSLLSLQGCDGSSSPAARDPEPMPPVFNEPPVGQESYSLLKQDGTKWSNQENQKVSLRGINLGNWLAMEIWMFNVGSDNALGAGIGDQCTLESSLRRRFGVAEKERLLNIFRDSWITSSDWDVIDNIGFNLVRIPFLYDLIENDANPMTLRDDAWDHLDRAIMEAKARNIYVILDLHGAAGRQGHEHHTGCAGQNRLWNSDAFRSRTIWLWKQIANKYKDEAAIAGYGLLNEPWGTNSDTLRDFIVELYAAIREIDNDHIIILPDHNTDGIGAYRDPADSGMENVAFETHKYPGIFGWGTIGEEVHRDWITCGDADLNPSVCDWAEKLRRVNTPLLIGETQTWTGLGNKGGDITRASYDTYNSLNWAVTGWSYKTISAAGGLMGGQWGLVTNSGSQMTGHGLPLVDVNSSGLEEIEAFFASFGTMDYIVNPWVLDAMTAEKGSEIFTRP